MLPSHWWFAGWSKRRSAAEIFRHTTVRGGYAATYRRLVRFGPWSVGVIRYRPYPPVPSTPEETPHA
ncbi:hypothetical protein [Plantactinospora sp. WMMB782]|uniref:hypothetical protein n=1 Tax=Plantactinospora sp. WMMB782 TaxID=3404121 RepID=UPI003B93B3F1